MKRKNKICFGSSDISRMNKLNSDDLKEKIDLIVAKAKWDVLVKKRFGGDEQAAIDWLKNLVPKLVLGFAAAVILAMLCKVEKDNLENAENPDKA